LFRSMYDTWMNVRCMHETHYQRVASTRVCMKGDVRKSMNGHDVWNGHVLNSIIVLPLAESTKICNAKQTLTRRSFGT